MEKLETENTTARKGEKYKRKEPLQRKIFINVPEGEDKNNVTYIGSSKMSICGQRQPASKTKVQINEVMLSKILGSNFKNKTLQSAKKRFHLQNCLYPVFSS